MTLDLRNAVRRHINSPRLSTFSAFLDVPIACSWFVDVCETVPRCVSLSISLRAVRIPTVKLQHIGSVV